MWHVGSGSGGVWHSGCGGGVWHSGSRVVVRGGTVGVGGCTMVVGGGNKR